MAPCPMTLIDFQGHSRITTALEHFRWRATCLWLAEFLDSFELVVLLPCSFEQACVASLQFYTVEKDENVSEWVQMW